MSKQKKKSWKEKQHDRQLKEKNAQKTYQQQREQAEKSKPRKLPKGKIILGIVIIFIVIGAYVIIQTPTTNPFETIYIRADGTIDPSSSSVSKISDTQYTLLDDIYGSIVIEKNNIVLDGANYVLNGDNKALSHGIDLTERNNVIIKNLEITNFGFGIYLFLSSNNTISQNNLSLNANGVWLEHSSTNEIIGNELSDQYAINLNYSPDNILSGNIISDCDGGIG
ncbi:right-handed parallel beta-helix repeat-containing protein, partial [Candidatus Bathyarchaeota archaeon]|nr:right-handed parallel beta-helix repeat-containing protein [Candidatus Bathyarchaeota archaeon]